VPTRRHGRAAARRRRLDCALVVRTLSEDDRLGNMVRRLIRNATPLD
jgi:ribosomal protein L32